MDAIIKTGKKKIKVVLERLSTAAYRVYHHNILVGTLQGDEFYPTNLIGGREFHSQMGLTYSVEIINL